MPGHEISEGAAGAHVDGQGHGAHPAEDGKYDYEWVDPADPRACEVKSIEVVKTVGEIAGAPGAGDNLLIVGDSGDALRSLGTIPEWAATYRGKGPILLRHWSAHRVADRVPHATTERTR